MASTNSRATIDRLVTDAGDSAFLGLTINAVNKNDYVQQKITPLIVEKA